MRNIQEKHSKLKYIFSGKLGYTNNSIKNMKNAA